MSDEPNSFNSDEPLLELLRRFPRGFSNIEESQDYVNTLRTLRLSPATFRSYLQKGSDDIERKRPAHLRVRHKKPPMTAEQILNSL